MRRPYSVHVFIYRECEPHVYEFLLLQRVPRRELGLPGFWQGVSGALESDEDFVDAAIREVREETGLSIDAVTATGFVSKYPIRPEWRVHYGEGPSQVEERLFVARMPCNAVPKLSNEHQAASWCLQDDAFEKLNFGDNRAALQSVLTLLNVMPEAKRPASCEAGLS